MPASPSLLPGLARAALLLAVLLAILAGARFLRGPAVDEGEAPMPTGPGDDGLVRALRAPPDAASDAGSDAGSGEAGRP